MESKAFQLKGYECLSTTKASYHCESMGKKHQILIRDMTIYYSAASFWCFWKLRYETEYLKVTVFEQDPERQHAVFLALPMDHNNTGVLIKDLHGIPMTSKPRLPQNTLFNWLIAGGIWFLHEVSHLSRYYTLTSEAFVRKNWESNWLQLTQGNIKKLVFNKKNQRPYLGTKNLQAIYVPCSILSSLSM